MSPPFCPRALQEAVRGGELIGDVDHQAQVLHLQLRQPGKIHAAARLVGAEDLAKLSQNTTGTLQALNEGLGETQAAIEKLRRDIESGAVSVKPVFPVVSADPARPKDAASPRRSYHPQSSRGISGCRNW